VDPPTPAVLGAPALAPPAPPLVFAVVAAAPPVAVPIALEPLAAAELAPALTPLSTVVPAAPVAGALDDPSLLSEEHAALSATNKNTHGCDANVRQLLIFTGM
jgi:hypothetical protein